MAKDSPKSDSAMSVVSNESIEVELRDPHSSFSSYESPASTASKEGNFLLDDMEMTKCVGGIISATIPEGSTLTDENNTMDLTTCIGGILNELPHYQRNEELSPMQPVSPSSVDTMELTRCVGGILNDIPALGRKTAGSTTQLELANADDKEHDDDDMDMTIVIKDTIKTNPSKVTPRTATAVAPVSPSPFLVGLKSPGGNNNVLNSPLGSEMSFIGDMDTPKMLGLGASPAPIRTIKVHTNPQSDDMDLTNELFNKYIDTSRFNNLTLHSPSQEQAALQSQSQDPSQSQPPSQTVGQVEGPQAVQTPVALKNNLPPSNAESPTVTLILPRASLKDFLNETGVRFLDNLSSLNRRETTGRPRESEYVTEAKQLYVDCGQSLESDVLDEACASLASMIQNLRDELQKQEEQFNHSPPLAFLQHRDPQERPTVISKLKTLKSISRLIAKQSWYQWRHPLHLNLNQTLEKNLQVIRGRLTVLVSLEQQLDQIIATLEPAVKQTTDDAATLQERFNVMAENDVEMSRQLEELVKSQETKLKTVDEDMNSLVQKEQELRKSIEVTLKRREELQHNVTILRQQIEAIPESSPFILEELQSSFQLLQGATGWKLVHIDSNEVTIQYVRAQILITLKLASIESRSIVMSVSFDVSQVRTRLLRHVPRILKVPADLSVPECLAWIGNRLDRLNHIDKELSVAGVQCIVSIPETIGANTDCVPLALGFYHAASHTKFDILLTFDGSQIYYSQFVHFYGKVLEQHVVDGINLALQHKYQPIKRLVASVVDIMEHLD